MLKTTVYLLLATLVVVVLISCHPGIKRGLRVRNTDIDFYGQVVDLNGVPVERLPVTIEIRDIDWWSHFTMLSYGTNRRQVELETDQDGKFQIENYSGVGIRYWIRNNESFVFNPITDNSPGGRSIGFSNGVEREAGEPGFFPASPYVVVAVSRDVFQPSPRHDREEWKRLTGR